MKKRQASRSASKRTGRAAATQNSAAPEGSTAFGRRRPREIELEKAPVRSQRHAGSQSNGLFRTIVERIFR